MIPYWELIIGCIVSGLLGFVGAAMFISAGRADLRAQRVELFELAERSLVELKRLRKLIVLADQDLVDDLEKAVNTWMWY